MRQRTLPALTKTIENDNRASAFVAYAKQLASGRPLVENDDPRLAAFKTAIGAQNTTTDSALRQLSRAFVAVLQGQTILGRLTGALPAPPGVSLAGIRSANWPDGADWLSEGSALPFAKIEQQAPRTGVAKFGLAIAFSTELTKLTDARADRLFEQQLLRGLRRAEDRLLLDDGAAVEGERPEGLLHGLTSVATSSPVTLDMDITDLWSSVSDGEAIYPHFIVSPRGAVFLASLHDDGAPRFPNVGPMGGDIFGVPVIVSVAAANKLVLVAAEHLVITDEGVELSPTKNALVEMVDTSSMSSITPAAATTVSAWQSGSTVLKGLRWLHWAKQRSDLAGFLTLPIGGSPS